LLTLLVALISPVAYWSGSYIWIRTIQDMLLGVVVPALIVLGAPWLVLLRGMALVPASPRTGISSWQPAARDGSPGEERVMRPWVAWPIPVTVAFGVIWWGWHIPVLYDLALRNGAARWGEYLMYLGAGTLFWLQLIGSRPFSPRSSPLRRVALLVGTVVAITVLAMVLVFGSGVLYPAYRGPAHQVLSVVADQQLGGAVMWTGILPPFIIAAVALLIRWLSEEDADALSVGLDRLLRQRRSTWPSRPGLR